MPDETEVVQSDLYVEMPLPNGAVVRGKPVPYYPARKILAAIQDRKTPYKDMLAALDEFLALTGITEAAVVEACPDIGPRDLLVAVQHFFFQPTQRAAKNGDPSTTATNPSSGA